MFPELCNLSQLHPVLTCILIADQTHAPVPALSCGQRDPLSPGQKTDEDIPDVHQQDMTKGTISAPTASRPRQITRDATKKQSFPDTRGTGICPPACPLHSKPLSSEGEQSTGKGMQWVKIPDFNVSQGSSLPLIPDLLSAAFHYHSPTLLSLSLSLPFPWRGALYKSSLI